MCVSADVSTAVVLGYFYFDVVAGGCDLEMTLGHGRQVTLTREASHML
jgi:hypothetical protein